MPIDKAAPARVQREGETYAVIPSSTLAAIRSPDAIAILAYLLDRPADWQIRRADLCERWQIGRDRYDRAMRELRALGLVWDTHSRGADGRVAGRTLHVKAVIGAPGRATEHTENQQVGKSAPDQGETAGQAGAEPETMPEQPETRGAENRTHATEPTEKPTFGETDLLHITELTNQLRAHARARDGGDEWADQGEPAQPEQAPNPEPRKPGPTRLPPDWYPSTDLVDRCVKLGLQVNNPEQVIAEFVDYWVSRGTRRADWDRTFINRMKQQAQFDSAQEARRAALRKPTDILADNFQRALDLDVEPRL
jgi:hypothetical protein